MSWQAWSEVGYGYPLWNRHNTQTVCRVLAERASDRLEADDLAELMRAVNGEIELDVDLEDIYGMPVSCVIAGLVNQEAGTTIFVGYGACGDTDQEEYIGVGVCYPWTMNDADRSLTKEKANEILVRWGELLDIDEAPDYFEAYYCG